MKRVITKGLLLFNILVLLAGIKAMAQQDPMYTQYMDNLLIVNAGYAGSKPDGNILLVSRNQWVSIPGAPVTHSISYNTRFKDQKFGLGFSVLFDKIGPQKQTGVYFDYSYFIRLSTNLQLGMGLKGGVNFYRTSFTDLVTIEPDPIYTQDIYKSFLPNIGVGFYLYSDKTYFGISAPKLVENSITRENYESEYVNKEKIHLYIVGGHNLKLTPDFSLKANAMLMGVRNAPVTLQATAMAGFRERFWMGGMIRFGDALGFIAQFRASPKILIGYSYDINTSKFSVFDNGTHEVMLSYNLNLY
jgi:type IX secretion system PorP/SprF family membrane protein